MLRAALQAAKIGRVSRQVGTPMRSFAEKAVAKEMDWDALSEMIHSDEGKRELASLRSTFSDIHSKLSSTAKDIPPPNWAEWSKELDPKIVDAFKKAFETTKLPAYQGDELAQAKSRFSEILEQANSFSASAAERIKEIEQELKDIEMEKERIATVTVDEELAADPKLAAEIDAENEKNSFLVTP